MLRANPDGDERGSQSGRFGEQYGENGKLWQRKTQIQEGISLDVLEWFRSWGKTVILSDGDVVFQPRKIERSSIFEAVDGNVLIYIHKEEALDDVERRYPAEHYVLVDDKLRILTTVKQALNSRVTTVFPRQGQYAHDRNIIAACPPVDLTVERIGDLLNYDLSALLVGRQSTQISPEVTR